MKPKRTFIDLFAGIGGFHLAMHNAGAECVFACEIDPQARKTYEYNFRVLAPSVFEGGRFAEDVTRTDPSALPDFDILCAGFPCQPFSNAGLKRGFADPRGNMFFHIARILHEKRPKAFFLENVRHLLKHDNGKTFATIQEVLTQQMGYSLHWKIVRASDFDVPQHRPRLFMVGFREPETAFAFPQPQPLTKTMSSILGGNCDRKVGFTLRVGGRGSALNDRRNWDGYLVDGKEIRLNPSQGAMMQGLPASFHFPVSERQAMKQLGNSVAIPAIEAVARQLLSALDAQEKACASCVTTSGDE